MSSPRHGLLVPLDQAPKRLEASADVGHKSVDRWRAKRLGTAQNAESAIGMGNIDR